MAQTNDTIDGLLAEFRGYSAGMPPSYHVTMSWADFRKMLDRFEAAHKRERGDAAKLREFARLVSHMNDDGYWNGSASICALVDKANAALASPQRNCERFQTKDAAREDFQKLRHHRVWADVSLWDNRDEIEAFLDWLFAPATEKEGGAK